MEIEKDVALQQAFGQRIRYLRKQRHMSQEQLSVHLGVTVVSVSHLERGVHPPAFNKLGRLAKAFGIEVWELFVALEDPIPPSERLKS